MVVPLKLLFAGLGLAAGLVSGCATPSDMPTQIIPTAAAGLPPAVVAAVRAAQPDFTIAEAELKLRDGRRYYDVEGRLPDGSEIELDLLESDGAWAVVEIQRDIAWADAPQPVRAAAAAGRAVNPVRVIESRQTDGRVIYELFAPGRPAAPALEVMFDRGEASVLTHTWPLEHHPVQRSP
ncbi:MAG: hypothetical protein KY446_12555 [Proteobacteria bacterium]|nr:hypothetical protein [Pseudomonadota bacterium]